MYKFSEAEHCNFKLRIHGYEVPFIGGRVSSGINSPASANIQIVPTKWAKMIRPGTIVHLFYKDHFSSITTGRDIYRLLFEGEVRSKSYQRAANGKAITLNCADFANYWLIAKLFYINFASGGLLGAANQKSYAGITTPLTSLLGAEGTISRAFKGKNRRFDEVVKSLLSSIGGINEYFKDASERLNLSDRIVSESSSAMTSEVFNHQAFLNVIENNISRNAGVEPLWKTISILLQMVFHEMVCLSSPSFIQTRNITDERASFMHFTENDISSFTTDWRRHVKEFAGEGSFGPGQFIIKPNAWMLEPPSCNLIYPNEVTNMSFVWDWQRMITRLQLVPTMPLFRNSGRDYFSELICTYAPYEIKEYMKSLLGKTKNDRLNRFPTFLTDEEIERGIIPGFMSIVPGATSFLLSRYKGKVDRPGIFKFVDQLSDFEYERQKAASSSFDAQMIFKPHLVPGFPSIFIDDGDTQFDVSALPTMVTHSFSSNGGASTVASFSLARELNEMNPGLDGSPPNVDGLSIYQIPEEPSIPAWFDESYTHGKVGGKVYSKLLGCGGLLNLQNKSNDDVNFSYPKKAGVNSPSGEVKSDPKYNRQHMQETRTKINAAISKLREEYSSALLNGQGGYHVWKATFRPIVTEEQLFEGNYNGKLLGSSSWYSGEQRTVVDADIFIKGLKRSSNGTIIKDDATNDGRYKTSNLKVNLNAEDTKKAANGEPISKQSKPKQNPSPTKTNNETVTKSSTNKPNPITGSYFYDTAVSYTLGKGYISGHFGPECFDCSGVVYGTALLLGLKNPTLRKFSHDLYNISCIKISPEKALNTKGAILFNLKTKVTFKKGKKVIQKTGHVGVSAGDGKTTIEGLNRDLGVRIMKRKNKNYWKFAGLLIGVQYDNVVATDNAAINVSLPILGKKSYNVSNEILESVVIKKITSIQQNRNEIIRNYQKEVFDSNAFSG